MRSCARDVGACVLAPPAGWRAGDPRRSVPTSRNRSPTGTPRCACTCEAPPFAPCWCCSGAPTGRAASPRSAWVRWLCALLAGADALRCPSTGSSLRPPRGRDGDRGRLPVAPGAPVGTSRRCLKRRDTRRGRAGRLRCAYGQCPGCARCRRDAAADRQKTARPRAYGRSSHRRSRAARSR